MRRVRLTDRGEFLLSTIVLTVVVGVMWLGAAIGLAWGGPT